MFGSEGLLLLNPDAPRRKLGIAWNIPNDPTEYATREEAQAALNARAWEDYGKRWAEMARGER